MASQFEEAVVDAYVRNVQQLLPDVSNLLLQLRSWRCPEVSGCDFLNDVLIMAGGQHLPEAGSLYLSTGRLGKFCLGERDDPGGSHSKVGCKSCSDTSNDPRSVFCIGLSWNEKDG